MGYFSRIAAQSGIRLPQLNHIQEVPLAKPVFDSAPLGDDESVFVPASLPAAKVEAIPEMDQTELGQARANPLDNKNYDANTKSIGLENDRAISIAMPRPNPLSAEMQPAANPGRNGIGSPDSASLESKQQATSRNVPGPVELSLATHRESAQTENPRKQVELVAEENSNHEKVDFQLESNQGSLQPFSSAVINSKTTEYFSRTAAILEKGGAAKEDIESKVLQDVQEWIAAANQASETANEKPVSEEAVAVTQARSAQTHAMVRAREEIASERAAGTRPLEQSFSLSIGTISVILDTPQIPSPPAPSAPPAIPAQQGGNGPGRDPVSRYSRISRSFI
jgi:hypothetical protein